MLAISLAIFLVVGDPTEGDSNAPWSDWAVPLTITVAVAVAATVGGLSKLDGGWRALLLGSAAGIFYGVAVAFTKYVTDLLGHGVVGVISAWQTWALIASGAIGVYLQQRAFQVGPLSASATRPDDRRADRGHLPGDDSARRTPPRRRSRNCSHRGAPSPS